MKMDKNIAYGKVNRVLKHMERGSNLIIRKQIPLKLH